VKKFIAMLLMGAVLYTGAVGCGGDEKDKTKDKPVKEKVTDKDKTTTDKVKDATK